MPVMNLHADADEFLYYLDALMTFPCDPDRREQLGQLNTIDALLRRASSETIELRTDGLRRLINIDSIATVRKMASELKRQGERSGQIMITLAMLAQAGNRASINGAISLVDALYAQFPSLFDYREAVGRRQLMASWAAFRSVAHLWAAREVLRMQELDAAAPIRVEYLKPVRPPIAPLTRVKSSEITAWLEQHELSVDWDRTEELARQPLTPIWEPPEADLVISSSAMWNVLQVADWFLRLGLQTLSDKRNRSTLRKEDMWSFPGEWVWKVKVSAPSSLPEWAEKPLKKYYKRSRRT